MTTPSRLPLIKPKHVRAAAAHFDRHPESRSHSNRWSVEIGGRFYTPRDLLREAASSVGWTIEGDELPRFEGRWRKKLESMPGVVVHERAINALQPGPGQARRPRPSDINAEDVRAAAKLWDKGRGFKNFGTAKRYHVWIDAEGDGKRKAYPPKAIVAIAARGPGLRPLRTNDFSGIARGVWHDRLKALDFRITRISKGDGTSGRISVILHKGDGERGRASSLSVDKLQDALESGRKITVPKDPTDAAIERLLKRGRLPTEAKRQVRARLGQGTFRSALLAAYGKCALTGETVQEVLRAAHIQRWADCSDDIEARLDLHNGLLLSANLDCLFEVGLIAIDAKGCLMISDELDDDACTRLGIHPGMPLRWPISERRAGYFAAHRMRVTSKPLLRTWREHAEAARKVFTR